MDTAVTKVYVYSCHTNVLCDWLNYFPFPVVHTHVKVSNKAIKHLQFAKYY